MSKIAHLLKPAAGAPPPRSPARAVLAAAIERVADMQREIEQTATASARLSEMRGNAVRAENAAAAAIETAKTNASAYYTSIALGMAAGRPQSVKEAHAAHAAAIDENESLTNAALLLRAKATALETDIKFASDRVNHAVVAVIADECGPIASRLAAEYDVIARDLADRYAALDWLSFRGAFGSGVRWRPVTSWPDAIGAGAWQMIGDALKTDPDAALPMTAKA